MLVLPLVIFSHPVPNSLLIFDIKEKAANVELSLPLSELELAFGKSLNSDPESSIKAYHTELANYIKSHFHILGQNGKKWRLDIRSMKIGRSRQSYTGPFNQLEVSLVCRMPANQSGRAFTLFYDAIVHQVINHQALITIRQDWLGGRVDNDSQQIAVISMNTEKNKVFPLKINLSQASHWKGFKSMALLGIEHIREGVDHLLFLLVLLLPSALLVKSKKWSGVAGAKESTLKIFKIITGFTIGHSLTLIAGTAGWLDIQPQLIEILIAVSVAITAVHAIWPLFPDKEIYIALGFGLIHGLAFAETLTGLHLSPSRMAISLLGFNLGIEIMQLFVVLLIMPWLLILSRDKNYRYLKNVSAFAAFIASVFWIIERVTGSPNFVTQKLLLLPEFGKFLILLLIFMTFAQLIFKKQLLLKKPV